jgi:hypothetical protein
MQNTPISNFAALTVQPVQSQIRSLQETNDKLRKAYKDSYQSYTSFLHAISFPSAPEENEYFEAIDLTKALSNNASLIEASQTCEILETQNQKIALEIQDLTAKQDSIQKTMKAMLEKIGLKESNHLSYIEISKVYKEALEKEALSVKELVLKKEKEQLQTDIFNLFLKIDDLHILYKNTYLEYKNSKEIADTHADLIPEKDFEYLKDDLFIKKISSSELSHEFLKETLQLLSLKKESIEKEISLLKTLKLQSSEQVNNLEEKILLEVSFIRLLEEAYENLYTQYQKLEDAVPCTKKFEFEKLDASFFEVLLKPNPPYKELNNLFLRIQDYSNRLSNAIAELDNNIDTFKASVREQVKKQNERKEKYTEDLLIYKIIKKATPLSPVYHTQVQFSQMDTTKITDLSFKELITIQKHLQKEEHLLTQAELSLNSSIKTLSESRKKPSKKLVHKSEKVTSIGHTTKQIAIIASMFFAAIIQSRFS